jgi:hypothetical protein
MSSYGNFIRNDFNSTASTTTTSYRGNTNSAGANTYGTSSYGQNNSYGGGGSSTPIHTESYQYYADNKKDDDRNKNKNKMKSNIAVLALNKNVLMWAGFFSVSLFVYFMISGGDFSFLMTYGGMARMFGFGILNLKIFKSQRATGVSVKTLQLYCIVFFFRLISVSKCEGYLPFDKSGDWVYHFVEGTSLLLASLALFSCTGPFKHTYQADLDKFGELFLPPGMGSLSLAGPILFLSIFIHPNLNRDFISDTAWTFAMYLESAALLPQLYMFKKQSSGVIELLMAHFVFALGFGRIMEFFFWLYSHHELENASGSKLPGYLAIASQAIQILLMLNFFRGYYAAMKNSTPMTLKTNEGMSMV